MKVIISESIYEMSRKEFKGVIDVAKGTNKCFIVAVEKNNIAEMKNEKFETQEELNNGITEYRTKGFRVYYKR